MDRQLYKQIFRRKSFHLFREKISDPITKDEIDDIYNAFKSFDSLNNIKTDIRIEKVENTKCKVKGEYCILLFSEKKDGYLQNIGYLGEQLDLYLVSKGIGSLWCGLAKCDEIYNGLNYVIMIVMAKVSPSSFRKDMYKASRKMISEIWEGDDLGIANIVRFAPSACNSQPWRVVYKDNNLSVYRFTKNSKVGIMPKDKALYFNQIDIGIFLCILELCLLENNIKFDRKNYNDEHSFGNNDLNAVYFLGQQ